MAVNWCDNSLLVRATLQRNLEPRICFGYLLDTLRNDRLTKPLHSDPWSG